MGPIFILGFPRSGTTAMADGIAALQRFGRVSVEGHFVYHFTNGISDIVAGKVNPASIVHDETRRGEVLRDFAGFLNKTMSPDGDPANVHWIDKTPDLRQVKAAVVLSRLYPGARFIFMYRPPLEAIRSNLANFTKQVTGRETKHAERWVELHATWRAARDIIDPEAWLEVYQPDMLKTPERVASDVTELLRLEELDAVKLGAFWRDNPQINRPRGRRKDEYDAVALSPEVAAAVTAITAEECRHWPKLAHALAQAAPAATELQGGRHP